MKSKYNKYISYFDFMTPVNTILVSIYGCLCLLHGLVIYFTKYDKVEKEIGNQAPDLNFLRLDNAATQSTTEWVCIEPDPDEEAPYETDKLKSKTTLNTSDKHYLIRF